MFDGLGFGRGSDDLAVGSIGATPCAFWAEDASCGAPIVGFITPRSISEESWFPGRSTGGSGASASCPWLRGFDPSVGELRSCLSMMYSK